LTRDEKRDQMTRRAVRYSLVTTVACALLFTVASIVAVPLQRAGAQPSPAPSTYRNPVFAQDIPDPSVLKVGREYYAYGAPRGCAITSS